MSAQLTIKSVDRKGETDLQIEEAWISGETSSHLCYGLRIRVGNDRLATKIEILEDRREPIHTLTLSKGKLFLNDKELVDLGI